MRRALVALLLTAPLPALAQGGDVELRIQYTRALQACLDKAGGVTAGMVDCYQREFAVWDARLNRAYQTIMASAAVAPAAKEQLRDAQRSWIAFRDRGCGAEAEVEAGGGSMRLVSTAACVLERTALRAHQLELLQ